MRSWLQRLGLQAPPPGPDEWVSVASYSVDNDTGSDGAADAVERLSGAGIEAQQRPYVLADRGVLRSGLLVGTTPATADERIRFAVLVHNRDRQRATELLRQPAGDAISDEELARESDEAAGA